MNEFYKTVNDLVDSLKNTEEYKKFIEIKEEIKKDEKKYSMMKDFKKKQNEMQIEYIQNNGVLSEEKNKELQNLYSILIQDKLFIKYFESEMKLDIMLADIQKVLGEAAKDIVEF